MNLIGRGSEKTLIRNFLKSTHKLLQVYGQPSVGKTCLVTEILTEMKNDFSRIRYKVIQNDWPKKEFSCSDENMKTLLIADNFQNTFGKKAFEDFNDFYEELIVWQHVKVILIFNGPSEIKHVQSITLHLQPLQYLNSIHLVQQSLPASMNSSSNLINFCSNFCDGVPGRIVSLGNKLSECPKGTSSKDILDFLQNSQNVDSFLPSQFNKSFKEYLQQLSVEQQRALSKMSYFPGKFSLHDMMALTNCKREQQAKLSLVYPLMNRGLIKPTDNCSTEFMLPKIVHQHCQNHMTHIFHEDCTRLKFNHVIGEALIKAEKIKEKGLIYNAVGIFDHKWENFNKLILEAIHSPSDGENFEIYCKVAVEARNIITLCYPEAASEFFKAVLDASKIFGTKEQQALLMVSYGQSLQSTITQLQPRWSTDFSQRNQPQDFIHHNLTMKEAQWHFKTALKILQNYGCDYQRLLTYNYMSLNYFRQGKLEKGIRSAEKALETIVLDRDRADVEHAKVYSYVHLTHNLIFAGNHSKAEEVLLTQLTLVGESGHPAVCYMLNNVGLNIERSGGSPNMALQFYLSSLFTKRSISCVQEHILVPTLCNVAGQFSKNRLRHDLALNFLQEAQEIRSRVGWVHPYTALVLWNMGMVNMRKGCLEKALLFLNKAERLYDQVNPNHYVNGEVKIWLAHCLHLLGDKPNAEKVLLEALVNKDMYLLLRPQSESVSCILEHLVRLNINNRQKCQEYLTKLHSELQRLYHFPSSINGKQKTYEEFYHWYVKIEDNLKRNVPFEHDLLTLPFTCLPCKEVIKFKMSKEEIYVKSLCNISSQNVSTEHSDPYRWPPFSPECKQLRSQNFTANLNKVRNIESNTHDGEHDRNLPNLHLLFNSMSLSEDRGENVCSSLDKENQEFNSSSLQDLKKTCLRQVTTLPNVSFPGSLASQSFPKRQTEKGENFSSVLSNSPEMKSEESELPILQRRSFVNTQCFDPVRISQTQVKSMSTLLLKDIEETGYNTTTQLDAVNENLRNLGENINKAKNFLRQYSQSSKKPTFKINAPDPLQLLKQLNCKLYPPNQQMSIRDHDPVSVTQLDDIPTVGRGALQSRDPTLTPNESFDSLSDIDFNSLTFSPTGTASFGRSWSSDNFRQSKSMFGVEQGYDETKISNLLSIRTACEHDELFQTDKKHPEQSYQRDPNNHGHLMTHTRYPEQMKKDYRKSGEFQTDTRFQEHLVTHMKYPEQMQRDQKESGQFQTGTRYQEHLVTHTWYPEKMQKDHRESGQFQTDIGHQEHLMTPTRYPELMRKDHRESGQFQTDTRFHEHLVTPTRYPELMRKDHRESGQFQTDTRFHEHLVTDTWYPEKMQKDHRESKQFQTDTRFREHLVTDTWFPEKTQKDHRESGQFQTDTGYQSYSETHTQYPEEMQKDHREFEQFQTGTRYQEHSVTHTQYPEQMQNDHRVFELFQTDTGYQSYLVTHTRYLEQMQKDHRESRQFQTDTGYQSYLVTDTRYPEQLMICGRRSEQSQTVRRQPIEHEDNKEELITPKDAAI